MRVKFLLNQIFRCIHTLKNNFLNSSVFHDKGMTSKRETEMVIDSKIIDILQLKQLGPNYLSHSIIRNIAENNYSYQERNNRLHGN